MDFFQGGCIMFSLLEFRVGIPRAYVIPSHSLFEILLGTPWASENSQGIPRDSYKYDSQGGLGTPPKVPCFLFRDLHSPFLEGLGEFPGIPKEFLGIPKNP